MTHTPAKRASLRTLFQALTLAFVTCAGMAAPQSASADASPHSDEVHGVFWDKSFLVRSGSGEWQERNVSGANLAFSFVEIYGNADEIILNDPSRDVDLRIDLNRMKIDYADAQQPVYRELYKLEGYVDKFGRQHFVGQKQTYVTPQEPDLSVTWNSDFGPIHWKDNFYGNQTKVLKGTLRSHGGPQYVYEGFWARTNSPARGSVLFVFSSDGKSFRGTYTASDGSTKTWNGFK